MANRALLAKVERASTQRRELGAVESGKDFYLYAHHYEKPVTRDDLVAMCAGVPVTKLPMSGYKSGTFHKRAGTCERRLWIGKPPRI